MPGQQRRGGPRTGGPGDPGRRDRLPSRPGPRASGSDATRGSGRGDPSRGSSRASARGDSSRDPSRADPSRGSQRGDPSRGGEASAQPRSARLGGLGRAPAPRPGAQAARPVARPSVARRSASGALRRAPARSNRYTGRVTVLVLVVGALLLAYAYPVRIYLKQQAEIAALREHQSQQRSHIADLQAQSDRWNDPEYVKAQARTRLGMGEPGETLWFVVGGDAPAADPASATPTGAGPWYSQLWGGIRAADSPKSGS